jgi:RsiW-degrading membrane proteinase PrsW (M82 family)
MSAPARSAAPTPRWGVQASIVQPRRPAFWLFLLLLGIGGYIFAGEQSYFSQLPAALSLSWVLVLLYAVPVFWVVYRLDLFEREPKLMLLAALLWGGVVATGLAEYANAAWLSVMSKVAPLDLTAQWGPAIVGPGVEETLKLLGVIVLFLIVPAEFDGVMDGFVYGAMVGLGFTVVEDVSYFIHAAVAFGTVHDEMGPVVDTFLIRVVASGLYTHVLFTGIAGIGFAYFATHTGAPMARRVIGFAICAAVALAAHGVWNSPWMETILQLTPGATKPTTLQWVEYGAVKGLPFLVLLVILVLFATKSEEKSFRAIVADESDATVITEDEIKSLRSLLARRSARAAAGRLRGQKGARLAGKLQAAQVEYAMIRSRVDSPGDPALEAQRAKIRGLRSQLEALPVVPPPVPRPKPAPVQKAPEKEAPPNEGPTKEDGKPPAKPSKGAKGGVVTWAMPPAAAPGGAGAAGAGAAAAGAAGATVAGATTATVATAAGAIWRSAADAEAASRDAAVHATAQSAAKPRRGSKAAAPEPHRAETAAGAEIAAGAKPAARGIEPAAKGIEPAARPEKPVWAPTHLVPPGGMAAWAHPDPASPPLVNLPERLELVIEQRAGAWAFVRAVNGWRGWVDGRRLTDRN